MKFKDKVAVITGSARGIGKATAAIMVREGARVVIADRDSEEAEATARGFGGTAIAVAADVGKLDDIAALFETTAAAFGHVDILINNAGIGSPHRVIDIGLGEWERVIRVNLTGAMLASQQAARRMIARGEGGRIVNITSLAAQRGITGRSAYGASKAGLDILTKIMALELAEHRINVNAVAPGAISTEMSRGMHTQETVEAFHRMIPQRRYGTPDEVAAGQASIREAAGKTRDQADRPVGRAEQQPAGIAGDDAAVEPGRDGASFDRCEQQRFRATLCRHQGVLSISGKSFSQNNLP